MIIKKRYPSLVLIEAIGCVVYSFIAYPIWTYEILNTQSSGIGWLETFVTWSVYIFTVYASHFIFNIEVWRLWLISFDLNYLHSSNNEQWKTEIDKNFADKDWYLSNKYKWGNKRYVIIHGFIYYLITATFNATVETITNVSFPEQFGIAQLINSVFFFALLIFLIYTYYKCPKQLNDNLLFQYEFRIKTIIFSISLILYILSAIVKIFGYELLGQLFSALVAIFALIVPSLVSTYWIPKKIASMRQWDADLLSSGPDASSVDSGSLEMKEINEDSQKNDDNKRKKSKDKIIESPLTLKVLNTLKNEEKFEKFVGWMYREFSYETILSFIEFYQYREFLTKYIKKIFDKKYESKTKRDYVLYDGIPKSSTIYGVNDRHSALGGLTRTTSTSSSSEHVADTERFKNIAHLLYKKYIEINSELEINISAKLRNNYNDLDQSNYDKLTVYNLVNLFDDVIDEMFKFMRQSFVRFEQSTPESLATY